MRLFAWLRELRRRRVFRGIGAYIVVAWFLAMFAVPLLPSGLRLYVYWLLALGAPLAALFSWIFRVRPGELELEDHHDGTPPATPASRALDAMVIVGLTMVVVASFVLVFLAPREPAAPVRETSPLYITPD